MSGVSLSIRGDVNTHMGGSPFRPVT